MLHGFNNKNNNFFFFQILFQMFFLQDIYFGYSENKTNNQTWYKMQRVVAFSRYDVTRDGDRSLV